MCSRGDLEIGDPPLLAGSIERDGLRPELISITREPCEIDGLDHAGPHRPSATITCLIFQVVVAVGRAPESALTRTCDYATAIGRPEPVGGASDEGFVFFNLSAVYRS